METRQKLEAEAGALRALLQEFLTLSASEAGLPISQRRLCCPEFGDKIRAALAVTDAGKEVADRISGYQEQLKLNTRLIELLRDSRTSLAAQNRHILKVLNDDHKGIAHAQARIHFKEGKYAGPRGEYLCESILSSVLGVLRLCGRTFNAHRYADLLSMAVKFNLGNNSRGPYIDAHFEGGWVISRFADEFDDSEQCWDHVAEAWDEYQSRLAKHFTFATLEAAFAYVEDHPAILGLQNVENIPKKVLDNFQPHR